jgi:hypothetical protein
MSGDPAQKLNQVLDGSEARELLERVVASESFRKSPRLRELLTYLCECAIRDPLSQITEQQIGEAVFGRPPHYDSAADTIVRVQVSQLRKRLEHYFLSDGREEAAIVDIPRGSYTPIFRRIQAAPPEAAPEAPAMEPAPLRSRPKIRKSILYIGMVLAAAIGIWLVYRAGSTALTGGTPATPALDRFWSLYQNGRQTQIVVTDGNLVILTDILKRTVSLHEYRDQRYPGLIFDAEIKDPRLRQTADNIAGTYMTSLQDAEVANRLGFLSQHYRLQTQVVSAREFRMLDPDINVILLGHNKGNPWMELFDERMNFHYVFDYDAHLGRIENGAPRAGEEKSYVVDFGKQGYCVLAYRPNPVGHGATVVAFGTDLSSLGAAGSVLSSEKLMSELLAHVGNGTGQIPYFEALMRTQLVWNLNPKIEFLAFR